MKRLDQFTEFVGPSGELGSIRAAVLKQTEQSAQAVATYLESFPIVLDVMERLPDVVDGSPVTQTASLRTDGVYCWRDDLSHYVRRHRVSLPAEFVARVGQAHRPMTSRELERAAREVLALWSDLP